MTDDCTDELIPHYQDIAIFCVECDEEFTWTIGEQIFFHDKGLVNTPKRCKSCKRAKDERMEAIKSRPKERIEFSVTCAQCGTPTSVPFYPSQGRPVYCRRCFLGGKHNEVNSEIV